MCVCVCMCVHVCVGGGGQGGCKYVWALEGGDEESI